MAATQTSATAALAGQLTSKGSESKKYRMTMAGLIGVVSVFVLCWVAQALSAPPAIFSLATATITAITVLVGAYTGSQAWVDARTTTALTP